MASLLAVLWITAAIALDLRPTTSPWLEDGTNIFQRVQRNVCVGVGPTATDALSICTAPVASATRALVNLSNTALSGGSANGTYLGANPAACTGDFLNFQLANAARTTLTCAGALTLASTTSATQYTSTIVTGTAPLVVSSTTQVSNLNVSQLVGATWIAPGTIGSTTRNTGAFTFVGLGAASNGTHPLYSLSTNNANARFESPTVQGLALEFFNTQGTQVNWILGVHYNASGQLELTPSTVAGGTTYSTPALTLTPTTVIIPGTLTSLAAGALGWTAQNAANQACNTTCTTGACVTGIDTAVLGNFLACTDATADTCLCAG